MDPSKKALTPPRDSFFGTITGHALSLRKDRLGFMHKCLKAYGDFLIMFIGKRKTLLINDPESIKYVLVDNFKNYPKNTPGYQKVTDILGKGVFTDVGEGWREGRRVIQPIFNPNKYDYFFNIIMDEADSFIKSINSERLSNKELNFSRISTKYALNVIGRSLINEPLEESFETISSNLSSLIELTELKMMYLTQIQTPSKRKNERRFLHHLNAMDDEIRKIIKNEKDKVLEDDVLKKNNFIKILINAKENFSDERILSQVKTMIFAGHETSANVLIWSFYFLATRPDWQERIYQESLKCPNIDNEEDLDRLNMLELFLLEVLRMRPPVWSFGRLTLNDDNIHGESVKKNDLISLSPYLIHHNEKYWDEPEIFTPHRFQKPFTPYSFIPFGAGQRVCMGERLAMIELKAFILKIVMNFKISHTPSSQETKMNPQVSLRADRELMLRIESRHS